MKQEPVSVGLKCERSVPISAVDNEGPNNSFAVNHRSTAFLMYLVITHCSSM